MSTLPAPYVQTVDSVFDTRSRSASKEAGPISSALHDGNFVTAVIIETAVDLSDAQVATLKSNLEAVTGVENAYVLLGPAELPFDDLPTGYDLYVRLTAQFIAKPTS